MVMISLLKVVHPTGYQLVVGGRLVSETRDGVVTPHHDLPEYTADLFPVDFGEWCEFKHDNVVVQERRLGRGENGTDEWALRTIGIPKSQKALFATRPPEAVRDWIRRNA